MQLVFDLVGQKKKKKKSAIFSLPYRSHRGYSDLPLVAYTAASSRQIFAYIDAYNIVANKISLGWWCKIVRASSSMASRGKLIWLVCRVNKNERRTTRVGIVYTFGEGGG